MSSRAVGRDRTRRVRGKSRIREALEETLSENVAQALEGNREAEHILVGHRREMDRLNRESTREKMDFGKDLESTRKLLSSENESLNILRKRKGRLEKEQQPTEIVEGQIVESTRRIYQYEQHESQIKEKQARLEQDLERERREALEDVSRKLRETK